MQPLAPELNRITEAVIGAAIEVHRTLGPGLLESSYSSCLCRELSIRGLKFQREVAVPLDYKGVHLECGYRIDILVEESVVLEIKAIDEVLPVHEAQLLTYLRLSRKRVGLILNFNVEYLKDGITRRVL